VTRIGWRDKRGARNRRKRKRKRRELVVSEDRVGLVKIEHTIIHSII
jgi:hypothetical protein